jgi:rRNA-processing protein FCF1
MIRILNKYDKIFIDTSSLLVNHENIFRNKNEKHLSMESDQYVQKLFFIDTLIPQLKKSNQKINLPFEVIGEIEKHIDSLNKKQSIRCRNALKILGQMQADDCINIYKGENYPFTDNIFITILFRYMTKYNMCLITQDRNLADDVDTIKEFRSINTNKNITAYMIGLDQNKKIKLFKINKRKK